MVKKFLGVATILITIISFFGVVACEVKGIVNGQNACLEGLNFRGSLPGPKVYLIVVEAIVEGGWPQKPFLLIWKGPEVQNNPKMRYEISPEEHVNIVYKDSDVGFTKDDWHKYLDPECHCCEKNQQKNDGFSLQEVLLACGLSAFITFYVTKHIYTSSSTKE